MDILELTYRDSFFRKRHKLNWRSPIVVDAIMKILNPQSVIDFGCATGDIISEFLRRDIMAHGVEGSSTCIPHLDVAPYQVSIRDLREKILIHNLQCFIGWDDNEKTEFDLAMSLEVAEHIQPEFATVYVQNLCSASHKILMSIAPPGQEGHGHVNCQPIEYWDKLFAEEYYFRKQFVADEIKTLLDPWKSKPGIKAFYHNLTYYEYQLNV